MSNPQDLLNDDSNQLATHSNDNQKLLRLILALKKKQEQTVKALYESEEEAKSFRNQLSQLKQLLQDSRNQQQQSHKQIQQLQQEISNGKQREQSLQEQRQMTLDMQQDLEEAISALQSQILSSNAQVTQIQETLAEAVEHNARQNNRIEKLLSAIQERDKKISELQKFEYTFKKGNEQKQAVELALEQELHEHQALKEVHEKLQVDFLESSQHAQQLERVIKFLRERSEEISLECNQLKDEFLAAQEKISTLTHNLHNAETQLQDSQQASTSAIHEKNECHAELEDLHKQFNLLKTKTINAQNELKKKDAALLDAHQLIENFKFEKSQLEDSLSFREQQILAMELALNESEEKLTAAHDEIKAAWNSFHSTKEQHETNLETLDKKQNEIEQLLASDKLLRMQIDDLHTEYNEKLTAKENDLIEANAKIELHTTQYEDLANDFDAFKATHSNIDKLFSSLKNEHADLTHQLENNVQLYQSSEKQKEHLQDLLQGKQEHCNELSNQINSLNEKNNTLEEELKLQKIIADDKDNQLKIAQQHLAKKVKETTLLHEKIKEHESNYESHQNASNALQAKISSLEEFIESKNTNINELEALLLRHKEEAEVHSRSWEDKYFSIYEKFEEVNLQLQKTRSRLQEIEKIEEKHTQLQSLLSNLGQMMGTANGSPIATTPSFQSSYVSKERQHDIQKPATAFAWEENLSNSSQKTTVESSLQPHTPPANVETEQLFSNASLPASKRRQNLFD